MEEVIDKDRAVEVVLAMNMVVGRRFKVATNVWGFDGNFGNNGMIFEKIQSILLYHLHNENQVAVSDDRLWLRYLKNAFNSVDNLMDDYEYEMLRRKLEFLNINKHHRFLRPSFKKYGGYIFTPLTIPTVSRYRFIRQVKKILSHLNNSLIWIKDEIFHFDVMMARSTGSFTTSEDMLTQIPKHATPTGSNFIGREDDQHKLLQLLLYPPTNNRHDDLPLIAIVGIGGIGKTTLVRRTLQHEKVEQQLSSKIIWICISEVFDIDRILKEMLESLTSKKCSFSSKEEIIKEIEKELKENKFLLVLDNVGEESLWSWGSLRAVLQRFGDPSKNILLITTRFNDVAAVAKATHVLKLNSLSEEDSFSLFMNQMYDSIVEQNNLSIHTSQLEVGKSIVKECEGIPLAIKLIGGLLKSKEIPYGWESVLDELWDCQLNNAAVPMTPSLILSYKHLSVSVKQCFVYCAIFQKDTILEKHDLIALWTAQGFLNESETTITGENYFATLVNSSFLEEGEVNELGEVKGYKMHDLIHDLAVYLLVEDASTTQHVVIDVEKGNSMMQQNPMTVANHTKTIVLWNGVPSWDFIARARYLRVLIVNVDTLSEISPTIKKLIHLRYLSLSYKGHGTCKVPEDICKLYQLQTLRLRGNMDVNLPRGLHKLKNLRHIDSTLMLLAPRGLGFLTNLQTLPPLELCDTKEGWTINELEHLDQIEGEVCISGLEHVRDEQEARRAGLKSKRGVFKLALKWGKRELWRREIINNIDEDVLGSLEPHPNIKSLKVEGFKGKRFLGWMKTMYSLIEVELIDCQECEQVPTLGQLPNLKILRLWGFRKVECIGNEFYENNSSTTSVEMQQGIPKEEQVLFGALRELSIYHFDELTMWTPAVSVTPAFPILKKLEIKHCKALIHIPSNIGEWTSLETLIIAENPLIKGPVPDLSKLQRLTHLDLDNSGEMTRPRRGQWIPDLHFLRQFINCYSPQESLPMKRDEDIVQYLAQKDSGSKSKSTADRMEIQAQKQRKASPWITASLVVIFIRRMRAKVMEKYTNTLINKMVSTSDACREVITQFPCVLEMMLQCLLFPEDYKFDKARLVHLWVAAGFLKNEPMEEYGDRFFKFLLEMSYINFTNTDILGGTELYKFNTEKLKSSFDQLGAITHFAEKMENASVVANRIAGYWDISVTSGEIDQATFGLFKEFSKLRSILFLNESLLTRLPSHIFSALEFLKTLDLSSTGIKVLPSSVQNAKQLCYLNLSRTLIEELPDSVADLCELKVLKLEECVQLFGLPKRMNKLTKLRHLDFDIIGQLVSMPEGIGALAELRTLRAFMVGHEEGCNIKELKNMNHLSGKFCISRLEYVSGIDDAQEAALFNKSHISQLEFRWSNNLYLQEDDPNTNCTEVLEGLKPNLCLEDLQIICFPGSEFPKWVGDHSYINLVSIMLYNCENCQVMPCLGGLPELQNLDIIEMNGVKEVESVPFPKLQKLTIDGMHSLEKWIGFSGDNFPSIVNLAIKHCTELNSLVSSSSLNEDTQLFRRCLHVEIVSCPKLESLPEQLLSPSLQTLIIEDCKFGSREEVLNSMQNKTEAKVWVFDVQATDEAIEEDDVSTENDSTSNTDESNILQNGNSNTTN